MQTREFDVGLFETISSLLQEPAAAAHPNRRDGERHPFQCMQLIAPFDGVNLPKTEDLHCVRCHDLSPRGFSYYAERKPATRQVIVGLGKIPFQFFAAEVVHARPNLTESGLQFHVGCRFLRRILAESCE